MDRIRIKGGARLKGEIAISGAKNAALPLMAACLLSDQPLVLENVPWLADIAFMADILTLLGVETDYKRGTRLGEGGRLKLNAACLLSTTADYDVVRKMRASFLVLGPLVARHHHARVSLPGGCAIGARPVDLHLKALEALGAAIDLADGYVVAMAPQGLKGTHFEFPIVSVGATENAMMAATLAEGETVLVNAAREPEIVDLGQCLIAMGAKIKGLGTSELVIEGVPQLHGATHSVLPDRIETGTYAMAAAIAGGEVELVNTRADLVQSVVTLLEIHRRGDHRNQSRSDGASKRRAAESRRRGDRTLSGLPDRPPGAVHGADDGGARDLAHPGNHLRKPLHACARTDAHGR